MLSDMDIQMDGDDDVLGHLKYSSTKDHQVYKNDDFERLCEAWVNEKCAPDILGYERDLVTDLLEMVEMQVRLFNLKLFKTFELSKTMTLERHKIFKASQRAAFGKTFAALK
jgi:hypothetical protein